MSIISPLNPTISPHSGSHPVPLKYLSKNTSIQSSASEFLNQSSLNPTSDFPWGQVVWYASHAIFVVVALVIIDWLQNTKPVSLDLGLENLDEPTVFSLAMENCCMVNGSVRVSLPVTDDYR